jgi:hypothetical protein
MRRKEEGVGGGRGGEKQFVSIYKAEVRPYNLYF